MKEGTINDSLNVNMIPFVEAEGERAEKQAYCHKQTSPFQPAPPSLWHPKHDSK